MITTDTIKIKKTASQVLLTSGYVDSELEKLGIKPICWAIVEDFQDEWGVSVSYEK
jgi:hypothetical protein